MPILPARDLAGTLAFFDRLGFDTEPYQDYYGFAHRNAIELHFTSTPDHDPWRGAGMAYVPVHEVDRLHAAFVAAGVWRTDADDPPCTDAELRRRWRTGEGLARITPPEDKPWDIREFALMDPNNNLLRFGQVREPR